MKALSKKESVLKKKRSQNGSLSLSKAKACWNSAETVLKQCWNKKRDEGEDNNKARARASRVKQAVYNRLRMCGLLPSPSLLGRRDEACKGDGEVMNALMR